MKKRKALILRCLSVLLMFFSIAFGITWRTNGYCLGDEILTGLGLKAWSDVTQGTHYAAVYGLALLLIAFFIFASTTNKKQKTFRYFIIGSIAVIILSNILFFAI